jgi:hypothetical protein
MIGAMAHHSLSEKLLAIVQRELHLRIGSPIIMPNENMESFPQLTMM